MSELTHNIQVTELITDERGFIYQNIHSKIQVNPNDLKLMPIKEKEDKS